MPSMIYFLPPPFLASVITSRCESLNSAMSFICSTFILFHEFESGFFGFFLIAISIKTIPIHTRNKATLIFIYHDRNTFNFLIIDFLTFRLSTSQFSNLRKSFHFNPCILFIIILLSTESELFFFILFFFRLALCFKVKIELVITVLIPHGVFIIFSISLYSIVDLVCKTNFFLI